MAGNIVTGVRRSMDIRGFLKNVKSNNGIKYVTESGKSHRLYIPAVKQITQDEEGNQIEVVTTVSEMHEVHEWIDKDGKFKSALCLAELGQECPFCNRVGAAWDIYKYRYEAEKAALLAKGMSEEQAKYEMEGDKDKKVGGKQGIYRALLDQRKMKEKKPYFYLLVAQFELDAQQNPVLDAGLPKFELKVMKLSEGRVEKLLKSLETCGGQLEGQELKIDYTVTDDVAERVGQSTTTVVFPQYAFTYAYAGLKDKIDAEAEKFSWDGIDKAFGELTVYTHEGATEMCDENFRSWDKYQNELKVNPNAHYLEYNTQAMDKPALNAGGIPAPALGASAGQTPAPAVGGVAPAPAVGGVASAPVAPAAPIANQAPIAGAAPIGAPVGAPVGGAPVGAPIGGVAPAGVAPTGAPISLTI